MLVDKRNIKYYYPSLSTITTLGTKELLEFCVYTRGIIEAFILIPLDLAREVRVSLASREEKYSLVSIEFRYNSSDNKLRRKGDNSL